MPEIVSVIEHQLIPVVESRSTGEIALAKRHVQLLSGLKTLPYKAFSWGHNSIKCSQFCGLIQLDDLTLEILPKIHGKESDVGSCRSVLIKMLRKAGLLKLHKLGRVGLNLQRHTLLDIFILDFCEQLDKQLVQGKLRRYISREENLPVLRGKLLPNLQFRHNLAHKERLYCQYDELSDDIYFNQLIKYTLRLLLPKARSQRVKKELSQLLYAFEPVSDIQPDIQNPGNIDLERSENRYQAVLELCQLFIQTLSPDTNAGHNESFALMFDMNQLFESWVAAILKPVAYKHGLKLREQGPRRYLAYRPDIGREVFQMKPDISFVDKSGHPVLIADAKWKILDPKEVKLGVSQSDLYQMQAYGNRYSTPSLGLIYPRQSSVASDYLLKIQGQFSSKLHVVTTEIGPGVDMGIIEAFDEMLFARNTQNTRVLSRFGEFKRMPNGLNTMIEKLE